MSKRKVTDVILELEQKINKILEIIQNQDLLLKNLNNKLGQLLKQQSVSPENTKQVQKAVPMMPGLKPGVQFNSQGKLQVVEQEDIEPQVEPLEVSNTPNKGQLRTARYGPRNVNKTIPVQQKIVYPDGKNVCLASVEIFNTENKLIEQGRTNAMGKWTAKLGPGYYTVNISKGQAANKPAVKLSYEIEIPESDTPLELSEMRAQ